MAVDDTPRPPRSGRFRRDGDTRQRDQRRQALITSMLADLRERETGGERPAGSDPLVDATRAILTERDDGIPEAG